MKLAALLRGLNQCPPDLRKRWDVTLLNTGQHYDFAMSEIFARDFGMPPVEFDLGVGSGTHGAQTAAMLTGIEGVCHSNRPDALVVFGDTNSTIAGALVGAKLGIPVVHIEAGLRSYDRTMPEEVNRVVADAVSSLLLCPCEQASANLLRESVVGRVEVVGDLMIDVAQEAMLSQQNGNAPEFPTDLDRESYVLATLHRVENTDNPERLSAVVHAIESLACVVPVVLPLHPRTREAAARNNISFKNVRVIEPVGYAAMIRLINHSRAVLTDSGGLQKEAHFFRKPCTTLRTSTEWTETLNSGWNVLCTPDASEVAKSTLRMPPDPATWRPLYGSGDSGLRCWEKIAAYFSLS